MKLAFFLSILCAGVVVLNLHADAPSQAGKSGNAELPELNVVLRVSKKFIGQLTTKRIQRTDPVYLCVLDSPITGTARTDATFTIQFDTSVKESAFVLQLEGNTASQTVAAKTLVQVFGSGQMDFTVKKRVVFDGKKYRAEPTAVDARLCSSVDAIATPPGLIGWIVQMFAAPEVRRRQPLVAEVAYEDGRSKLADSFDQEATKLVDQLNQVSPLQETVATLFPEVRDWTYYMSTSPTHLVIGAGPRDHSVPELPVTNKTQAPIELWVRGKEETKGILKVLKVWRDAGKQLVGLLPEELRKTIKSDEGFKTLFVKEWFVIQIGPVNEKPNGPETKANDPVVVWRPAGTDSAVLPLGDLGGSMGGSSRGGGSGEATQIVWRPASNEAATNQDTKGACEHVTVIWRPVMTQTWEMPPP
jgi:hypothetical protein